MITLNATKVERQAVKVELSESELFNAASSNISTADIVKILKARLCDEIVRYMEEFDPELRRSTDIKTGNILPPKAYVTVCLESGYVTKAYYPPCFLNKGNFIRTRIVPDYLNVIETLNKLAKMQRNVNEC